LRAFQLKFTINANIVYIPVESKFSTSLLCPNTMVSILTVGLLLRLLCPDLSDPSSLTERTSDNQLIVTCNFCCKAPHATQNSQLD